VVRVVVVWVGAERGKCCGTEIWWFLLRVGYGSIALLWTSSVSSSVLLLTSSSVRERDVRERDLLFAGHPAPVIRTDGINLEEHS
jgi:hypothetical protein